MTRPPDSDDWVRALVGELPELYARLGAELGGQAVDPDPSTPGGDAGHLVAATVVTTPAPVEATVGRAAPGSSAPLDLEVLAAQERIWLDLDDLVERLREARGLPHPAVSPMPWGEDLRELERRCGLVLPLLDALGRDQRQARWVETALRRVARARDAARRTLGETSRTARVGLCPVDREPYPAAWDDSGAQVLAWWDDRVCRRYDDRASEPRAGGEVWRRSVLRVDPRASAATREGDIVCPGCGARWEGEAGRRRLGDLLGGLGPDPATAAQIERWYGIPASTVRNWVAEGILAGDGRPMRFTMAEVIAIRDDRQPAIAS